MRNGEPLHDIRVGDVLPFASMVFTRESANYTGVLIAGEGVVEMILCQFARVAVDVVDSLWYVEGDMLRLDANNGSQCLMSFMYFERAVLQAVIVRGP